ncbi:L-rhamnose mutarotase [Luteitalea sp.]|jgi:L-rhamnose mutarotase|uniref:L-rhamnose mutarotase n=1 Tax=Luteitalea sp. TaxID=2004800 RepID=UPI0037C81114
MSQTETVAFRMRLHEGQADEYQRRHDAIWPELDALLRESGVVEYRIFLDEETRALFAVLTRRTDHTLDALPDHPIMKRWWAMMADIMDTNADQSPVQVPLREVFRMQ